VGSTSSRGRLGRRPHGSSSAPPRQAGGPIRNSPAAPSFERRPSTSRPPARFVARRCTIRRCCGVDGPLDRTAHARLLLRRPCAGLGDPAHRASSSFARSWVRSPSLPRSTRSRDIRDKALAIEVYARQACNTLSQRDEPIDDDLCCGHVAVPCFSMMTQTTASASSAISCSSTIVGSCRVPARHPAGLPLTPFGQGRG
jgi:hypothetical protein